MDKELRKNSIHENEKIQCEKKKKNKVIYW